MPCIVRRSAARSERQTFQSGNAPFQRSPEGRFARFVGISGVAFNLLCSHRPPKPFVFRETRIVIKGMFRYAGVCAVAAALAALWSMPGEAQGRRRGGPLDWSHARIMAAKFGPDGDRNIAKNYR